MKRTATQAGGALVELSKRPKGPGVAVSATQLVEARRSEIIAAKPTRTSQLQAPIMCLEGHGAEILATKFNHKGDALASGSFDNQIFLWRVYGDCENYALLTGHKGAVTQVDWSLDDTQLVSSSSDMTVGLWDAEDATRIRKFTGHRSFVNACAAPHRSGDGDKNMLVSGSDDGTARVWDVRQRAVARVVTCPSVVTAVCCGSTGHQIFTGGVNNEITCWDLRNDADAGLYTLDGHDDTITSLSLSPDGGTLLSNSMDHSVRTWSAKPFSSGRRQLKIFTGAVQGFEKRLMRANWSSDGRRITAGSSDHQVYVWDVASQRILYRLPGHKGSVIEVDMHPTEPILASGSTDKTIYLGEIVPSR